MDRDGRLGLEPLVRAGAGRFRAAVAEAMGAPPSEHPPFYGKPGVSERIVDVLEAVTIRKSSA